MNLYHIIIKNLQCLKQEPDFINRLACGFSYYLIKAVHDNIKMQALIIQDRLQWFSMEKTELWEHFRKGQIHFFLIQRQKKSHSQNIFGKVLPDVLPGVLECCPAEMGSPSWTTLKLFSERHTPKSWLLSRRIWWPTQILWGWTAASVDTGKKFLKPLNLHLADLQLLLCGVNYKAVLGIFIFNIPGCCQVE